MMTKPYVFLAALVACLSLACNEKGDPPPQFNTVLGAGDADAGRKLLPIRLVKRDKAALIASAASSDTPPSAGGPAASEPGAAQATVDTSTPEAAARSFANILKSNNLALLPEIVVPEQREAAQQLIRITQPVLEAQAELERAIAEKFPGHAFRMAGTPGGMPADVQITDLEISDTEASATLEAPGSPAKTIRFRQVDGSWRVEAPELSQASEADQQFMSGLMNKIADAFRNVAGRINDGSITDVQAIPAELAQATAMPEALFSITEEGGNATAAPGEAQELGNTPAEPGI